MARTKQEVRDWLEKQVNKTLSDPHGDWTGECVTLIKCLMDFIGVSDPYAARGNAKDAANTYLSQGIASNGKGWLTICVNKNWGVGSDGVVRGHIWTDLQNEHSYEQNGKVYHVVTKDTKNISSATQWANFDKWIKEEDVATPAEINLAFMAGFNRPATREELANKDFLKSTELLLQTIYNNNLDFRTKAANFDALQAQYNDLKAKYDTSQGTFEQVTEPLFRKK